MYNVYKYNISIYKAFTKKGDGRRKKTFGRGEEKNSIKSPRSDPDMQVPGSGYGSHDSLFLQQPGPRSKTRHKDTSVSKLVLFDRGTDRYHLFSIAD